MKCDCCVQGSVVTICSDECVHLWEISNRDGISFLQHVRSLSLENKYAVYQLFLMLICQNADKTMLARHFGIKQGNKYCVAIDYNDFSRTLHQ